MFKSTDAGASWDDSISPPDSGCVLGGYSAFATVMAMDPLISPHFNLTVELPLKAIVRGYSYSVVPNHWINRKAGESKLKIKEMGSRYLFIVLYCFIEKWLSRGDYRVSPSCVESVSNASEKSRDEPPH